MFFIHKIIASILERQLSQLEKSKIGKKSLLWLNGWECNFSILGFFNMTKVEFSVKSPRQVDPNRQYEAPFVINCSDFMAFFIETTNTELSNHC